MKKEPLAALAWKKRKLVLLDQTALPGRICYRECDSAAAVAGAIERMIVRGAPAIGISAAFGLVLAVREAADRGAEPAELLQPMERAAALLLRSRPTAVNLAWAVKRIEDRLAAILAEGKVKTANAAVRGLEAEALAILREDAAINRRIGDYGAELVPPNASILTHCNAGALATGGYGTALGVIRSAWNQGKNPFVYAGETRPLLQGARLTTLELHREGIPVTLVTDNSTGHLMARGRVDMVIVGADRIAANGDTANKIGTYNLAVQAWYHNLPFYIAAPLSTVDRDTVSGQEIVIEERSPSEVTSYGGYRVVPEGVPVLNPAFDVTPAALIRAIITEKGIVSRPDREKITALFHRYESIDELS